MPIEVDAAERYAEIAQATVTVARERGTRAVTVRSVAEQLGRSTAFITHFVPSRARLMVNALEHAQVYWEHERADELRGLTGIERLLAVSRWMCTTSDADTVLRSLWIEVIADIRGANREAYNVVRATTDSTYDEFLRSAHGVDREDAGAIADILYLYGRGFHVKSVEDPDDWNAERANRSLDLLLRRLLSPAGV